MHDRTIDRTTVGTGQVASLTAEQLSAVRLDDGSRMPFLRAPLRIVARHAGLGAMLELKRGAMPRPSLRIVRAAVLDRGLRRRVTVTSMGTKELAEFRELAPQFHTSLIRSRREAGWRPNDFLPFGGANVVAGELSNHWIRRAHAIGLPLIGRYADDEASWEESVAAGVVAQVLDRADAFRAWCSAS